MFKFSFFSGKRVEPISAPKRIWNRFETALKYLLTHHLRLYTPSITTSLLYIAFLVTGKKLLILYILIWLPENFEGQWLEFNSTFFSGNRRKPRKDPQKGLKPLWNRVEIPSGSPSQTLYSCDYCIIALYCFFSCRKDTIILYILISLPDHFEA